METKLAQGVVAPVSAPVTMDTVREEMPIPVKAQAPEKKTEEVEYAPEDFYIPPDMDAPPDESLMGGNVYFDGPITPMKKAEKETEVQPREPVPAVRESVKPKVGGDAKTTFGAFLRSVRKTARNGVLVTMCVDLDGVYEDGVFVLYTASDTIYRSLSKPDHAALIAQAFENIGLSAGEYEVRLKGKQSDSFQKSVNEIKETFGGVKIEIK